MTPRERVWAALEHRPVDRIPRFEVWIDALLAELGQTDAQSAAANLGQDAILLSTRMPPGSRAWQTGVDEWGRVWQDGIYVDGVVDTPADLRRYQTPIAYAEKFFDLAQAPAVRQLYPEHCLIYGTHIGPFMAAYMAMGFARFFMRLLDDPDFVHDLLKDRTAWCIAMFKRAIALGAEVIVMGDDAAHGGGPMIDPQMWREIVLPYHRQIVSALDAPVIWHSDGDIVPLLPMAVEAGFVGVHGLEPAAGVNLVAVKRDFGRQLTLIGNVDVRLLAGVDLAAVRADVDRCVAQGAPGGGYMLSTCNSIFSGLNPAAVAEMFRYQAVVV